MANIYHSINKKSHEKTDFPIGSVVAFVASNWLGIGIVVKHTPKNLTIIYSFRSYSSSYAKNGTYEAFGKSSRDPSDVILTDIENIENPKELEEVLSHWNRINKTDIEIKIT
jgi:hypothetical protein